MQWWQIATTACVCCVLFFCSFFSETPTYPWVQYSSTLDKQRICLNLQLKSSKKQLK